MVRLKLKKKRWADPAKVLEALRGTSRETAIKADDLEDILGLERIPKERNRTVRIAIEQLRRDGHCISSNSKGYFMTTDMLELLRYIGSIDKRIQSEHRVKANVIRAFHSAHPNKLILRLKNE